MDDVIYYVNGTYRLLEFLVALCVVAYGVSETIFGEWTVMGSMIIFIHSYYNVWLRAQLGWKSFLLRRDAVNKIKSLPIATKEQLEKHNDICAICYQVLGTLFIYVLFMVEEFRKEPVENMDDVIYYVNGTYRLLEFLVALCVVAYGVSETIFGEWTVMGSMIIFIHSYYNVWLRAQLGWKSFLLRRDAVNKIKSLPIATKEQLEKHNDICAICYQDMKSAVITPCSHFFHAGCLKKWLYVQETCPLCHCHLKNSSQLPGLGTEPAPQPHAGAEQNVLQEGPELPDQEHPPGTRLQEGSRDDNEHIARSGSQEGAVEPQECPHSAKDEACPVGSA
ncbi:RING finger protein 145 [Tupaia chinensis]|uniref:RING finger protein 145 n=1 Tax=Tupaia chinensis TaxID=246437 RepID=L8Y7R0_TUPCH|nr:RING finger protein 145 [Tupaia chinensis]